MKEDAQLVTVPDIVESRGYPKPRNPLSWSLKIMLELDTRPRMSRHVVES